MTDKKIRLMLALSDGGLGGGQQTVYQLARLLDAGRFDVTLLCPPSPTLNSLAEVPGVTRIPFSFPTRLNWKVVKQLKTLIQKRGIQILHTHLYHADLYGWLATRAGTRPRLLSTVQGINFFWEMETYPRKISSRIHSHWYRGIYRSFDGVAACSEALKQAICTRRGIQVPPKKVRAIHNSIDVEQIRADGLSVRNAQPFPAVKKIVTVANFYPVKGHRVLLEALRHLANDSAPPFECLLVGEGPERSRLEQQAREAGLGSKVRFIGSRSDIPSILKGSDLFVFPSRWDGLGIAVLEAMAVGLPVVACAAGGVPEIIRNGENGILVPPDDPAALADGIRGLLKEPESARRLIAPALETVESRFDARRMVQSYEIWYEQSLNQKKAERE